MLDNRTLFIGDEPYKYFSKAKIGRIPIFDLLPGVKNRLIRTAAKIYLNFIISPVDFVSEIPYEVLMETCIGTPDLSNDECITGECLNLVKNLYILDNRSLSDRRTKSNKENYTIYNLIEVAYFLCSGIQGSRCFRFTEFRRFKTIVFELPQVNPLLCSVKRL